MPKIPYVFMPVPYEFTTGDFLKDHDMMQFIFWIMRRISTEPHRVPLKTKHQHLMLDPFEFMYGRSACAREIGITEDIVRTRVDQLLALGYIEKIPSKSTNTFSVFRLGITAFRQINNRQSPQQVTQQTDQQIAHNRKAKPKDLDIEETSYAIEGAPVDKSPLSDEENREVDGILAYCEDKGISLKRDVVSRWLKKRGSQYVVDHISLLLPNLHKIKKPEAWLERAQKENYVGQNRNILMNREFAEKFKAEKKWSDLDLRLTYCVHRPTGNDYQYKLPPESFREMLTNCYNQQYSDG